MRKRYGRLQRIDNVIVFPGTFERLVEDGIESVEEMEYDKAIKAFDQAILYEPDETEFLGAYAVALYETKDFHRAKVIVEKLLHTSPDNYLDAMELYLTILIQLGEYEDVEMTLDVLVTEDLITKELMSKFNYLRELNSRLSKRYASDEMVGMKALFTLEEFSAMDIATQQQTLASLEGMDLSMMTPLLEEIVENVHFSPIVITFALTLLHQANDMNEITVQKFGKSVNVVPANMALPGQDEQTKELLAMIEEQLEKDPSRLELAKGLIEKFTITVFPFNWGDYDVEEIATSYIHYIESLFSGKELPATPLYTFIQQIDNESDFDKV